MWLLPNCNRLQAHGTGVLEGGYSFLKFYLFLEIFSVTLPGPFILTPPSPFLCGLI